VEVVVEVVDEASVVVAGAPVAAVAADRAVVVVEVAAAVAASPAGRLLSGIHNEGRVRRRPSLCV
jgi:hypothetical protein